MVAPHSRHSFSPPSWRSLIDVMSAKHNKVEGVGHYGAPTPSSAWYWSLGLLAGFLYNRGDVHLRDEGMHKPTAIDSKLPREM